MTPKAYARTYQQTQVATIDRARLLLLVLDGGLKFLKLTNQAGEQEDWPRFAEFLSKSQAIIAELMSTLDHRVGQDLSRNLERLYEFMLYHLTDANVTRNPAKVREVTRIFEVIAGAFREVIENGAGKSRGASHFASAAAQTASAA